MSSRACDYRIPADAAEHLKGVVVLPAATRRELLARYVEEHGAAALADLFAEFIGLSNSVVENSRECIEYMGILALHPDPEHRPNLPTVFGALCGVALVNGGTGRHRFMCHRAFDDDGDPVHRCVGFEQVVHADRAALDDAP